MTQRVVGQVLLAFWMIVSFYSLVAFVADGSPSLLVFFLWFASSAGKSLIALREENSASEA